MNLFRVALAVVAGTLLTGLQAAPPIMPSVESHVPIHWTADRDAAGVSRHDHALVQVSGTATSDSDAFYGSPAKFFLEDSSGAVAVYWRKPLTRVRMGDRLIVHGRVSTYAGSVEIVASSVSVVGRGIVNAPAEVTPADLLGRRYAGRLVRTEGELTGITPRTRGLMLTLRAGDSSLAVYLSPQQAEHFNRTAFKPGTTVQVTGFASQHDITLPYQSGWQILPRSPVDLIVVRPKPLVTTREAIWAIVITIAMLALLFAWSLILRRQVARQTRRYEQALTSLTESEERYRLIFEDSVAGLFRIDSSGSIITVNSAAAKLLGFSSRNELVGRKAEDFCSDRDDFRRLSVLMSSTGILRDTEIRLRRNDGSIVWVIANATAQPAPIGSKPAIDGAILDITDRKGLQDQMQYLAYHDPVTSLPNRLLFHDRVSQQILHSRRQGEPFAVVLMDIDRFKRVNDTLGHFAGDELLRGVGSRLKDLLLVGDSVARLAGDEFALLLALSSAETIDTVARKLLTSMASPFRIDEHELHVAMSIGVAFHPADGDTPEALLRAADAAMYSVKHRGGNGFNVVTLPRDQDAAIDRLVLENDLRAAIQQRQLSVFYQPVIHVASGEVVGAEALCRWFHPRWGQVPPSLFIPLAEEVGIINQLGEWVLDTAAAQIKEWDSHAGKDFVLSVNVSARQLSNPLAAGRFSAIVAGYGIAASRIELEVTESVAAANDAGIRDAVLALHDSGFRISIDDFGTGHSSFTYIQRLPVDTIKIDAGFVRNLPTNRSDLAIVSTVISMAHEIGARVIAEGVENEAQRMILAQNGCDLFQGFLVSAAVAPSEFAGILAIHRVAQQICPALPEKSAAPSLGPAVDAPGGTASDRP